MVHGLNSIFARLGTTAGITGHCNPHSLRHGWALAAIRRGCDLASISQILGHRSISITIDYYGRFDDAELQARYLRGP